MIMAATFVCLKRAKAALRRFIKRDKRRDLSLESQIWREVASR